MMSNFFVLILYILWNVGIQNGSKLRTHNQNPAPGLFVIEGEACQPHNRRSLGGNEADLHFSPTHKKSLKIRALPQLIHFGQPTLAPKAIWWEDRWGREDVTVKERVRNPDPTLVLCRVSSVRQDQFKGLMQEEFLQLCLTFCSFASYIIGG